MIWFDFRPMCPWAIKLWKSAYPVNSIFQKLRRKLQRWSESHHKLKSSNVNKMTQSNAFNFSNPSWKCPTFFSNWEYKQYFRMFIRSVLAQRRTQMNKFEYGKTSEQLQTCLPQVDTTWVWSTQSSFCCPLFLITAARFNIRFYLKSFGNAMNQTLLEQRFAFTWTHIWIVMKKYLPDMSYALITSRSWKFLNYKFFFDKSVPDQINLGAIFNDLHLRHWGKNVSVDRLKAVLPSMLEKF